jgi:cytosine/uracil/thiamine/allantoin permease
VCIVLVSRLQRVELHKVYETVSHKPRQISDEEKVLRRVFVSAFATFFQILCIIDNVINNMSDMISSSDLVPKYVGKKRGNIFCTFGWVV